MGWWARLALGSGVVVAGCAALAGVEEPASGPPDPSPIERGDASSSGSSGASGSSGSSGASGTSGGDASTDARPDASSAGACPAPKLPTGTAGCTANVQCCSNACDESSTCAPKCVAQTDGCDPSADAPCCHGLYCRINGFFYCDACLGSGSPPRQQVVGGGAKSCCSRQTQVVDGGTVCK